VREEGLRAAALPGRVAAADAVALDAGPRAHERVGHIYQSVFGVALREQVLLGRKDEPPDGCVARVPEPREVLEVRAARLASTDENVVVQALEPAGASHHAVRDCAVLCELQASICLLCLRDLETIATWLVCRVKTEKSTGRAQYA